MSEVISDPSNVPADSAGKAVPGGAAPALEATGEAAPARETADGAAPASAAASAGALPPVAPKRFGYRVRDIHGEHVDDGWDWLRDEENPEVIAHLDAENAWADAVCAPTRPLAERIAAEVKGHAALDDVTVPTRDGDFWYFRRWRAGSDYATHHRVPANPGLLGPADLPPTPRIDEALPGEQLTLDENAEAAGREFFRAVDLVPSPDGRLIAWARDVSGDERYQWIVRDAATGATVDEAVVDAGYGFAWAADSASFLYVGMDEAWRSCEIWHHRLGESRDEDRLLLVEPDERFSLWITEGADPGLVVIASASTTSGRAWAWLPSAPAARPVPLVAARPDVQVSVESAADHLLLVHTATTREGALAAAPLPADLDTRFHEVGAEFSRANLGRRAAGSALEGVPEEAEIAPPQTWIPVREPGEGERILDVEANAGFCVLTMRSGALTQVEYRTRSLPLDSARPRPRPLEAEELRGLWGPGRFVESDSPVRTLATAPGPRFEDGFFRVSVQSQITPASVLQVDPASGATTLLKIEDAPGWDPADFVEERVWVDSRDGKTRIPVTLVHRRGLVPDGTNAGWQIGYGSYEISYDPEFEILRLPLLERGVVLAIAHVRGGGELGRAWYEDGKMLVKLRTFEDFVDVADWLVDSGWVAPDRLIAEGRSAGGLLMGAVLNMAPSRFRVVVAGVPFVDALTTILDPSLPLTVGEWEEWGNPIEDPAVYAAMRAYTPYENVPEGVELPAVMATTSVNDTRVEFVEPTKWVQRLREASGASTDADLARARPIVLRTQMVAGHAGPSGREGRWAARAEEFAFALGQVGIAE
ncbi:S9 family peptidase [Actinomyces culturomici]|uniref:S9 family peptidase n=1 Tax=Actinomyces culturomici TaxID=1926276 RepID=UPI000E20276B|nr:prolyl oligopeptidase family serine peptidase [Actinomyces culturomici]